MNKIRKRPFKDYLATIITDEEYNINIRRRTRLSRIPDWIYDYEDTEIQFSKKLYDNNYLKNKIDIIDFFPDLKFNLPYCDRLPSVPIWTLLPYYNHIIVWVDPFKSQKEFTRCYGIDPKNFIDLCGTKEEPGKIIPILNSSPVNFSEIGFFESLLKLKPPTLWRDFYFQKAIAREKELISYRKEGKELFKNITDDRNKFLSLKGTNHGNLQDFAITTYTQICTLGGRELALNVIDSNMKTEDKLNILFFYSIILYDSVVSPLNGIYPCTHTQINELTKTPLKPTTDLIQEFPVEIGTTLLQKLRIPLPSNKASINWWLTEARDLWKPARKALEALCSTINNEGNRGLNPKIFSFEETWQNIAKDLSKSNSLATKLSWALSVVGIMGCIGGFTLMGLPGIIASVTSTALTMNIFDFQAVYNRLARPNHLVTVIDLVKYLNKHPYYECK